MAPWFKGQNVKLQCGDNENNILECWIQVNEEKFYDLGDHESIKGILSQNPMKIKKSATAERIIKLCYEDGVKPKSKPILGRAVGKDQRIFCRVHSIFRFSVTDQKMKKISCHFQAKWGFFKQKIKKQRSFVIGKIH